MGRFVGGVVVCALAGHAVADAQPTPAKDDTDPPPVVRVAPAETSWYATAPPASAPPTATASFHRAVDRGGLVTLAGLTVSSQATLGRVDVGVPTPKAAFRRLRTFLVAELGQGSELGTRTADVRHLVLAPELQYDWRVPFRTGSGDLVLVLGLGVSWARRSVRLPAEPYWPPTWESMTELAGRVEVALQYRARSGLIVAFYPVTASLPFSESDPPDARWMTVDSETHYAASFVAGYQFQ